MSQQRAAASLKHSFREFPLAFQAVCFFHARKRQARQVSEQAVQFWTLGMAWAIHRRKGVWGSWTFRLEMLEGRVVVLAPSSSSWPAAPNSFPRSCVLYQGNTAGKVEIPFTH